MTDAMTKPTEVEMVLVIADIAGFTRACRNKTDTETFEMLDRFYQCVGKVVSSAGGIVVKFMGDCALVVFPADKARQAVVVIHELKVETRDMWAAFSVECVIRIHAHAGRVVIGPMGPDQKFDVVGKTVNDLFRMPWDGPEISETLRKIIDE